MLPNEILDPFESAGSAVEQEFSNVFFGQNFFDIYLCVLEKGGANKGKPPFDPNLHKPEQKKTAISISIQPLPNSKAQFPVERSIIAEIGKNWTGIIRPSIAALFPDKSAGEAIKMLHGKWVKVEIVETGGTYQKNGETKKETTVKYLEVYDTEEACRQAAEAVFGSNGNTEQPPATNGNAEREVALKFLPALATQAQKDPARMAELLANNSLVGKYFTINSPEVITLLS